MKNYLYLLIVLIGCFFCNSLVACMFMGKIHHPHEIVIDEANNIILAKAVSYTPQMRRNHEVMGFIDFQVIEILKGASPNIFRINAWERSGFDNSFLTSLFKYMPWFNYLNHDNEQFWKENSGRITINNSMCILIPNFSIDSTYLIINGEKEDSKNFELIIFETDEWLKYVRNRLKYE